MENETMNKLLRYSIVTSFLLFLLTISAIADEIVVNKAGQSVLLKSSGTWKILQEKQIDKIVIRITGAKNHLFKMKDKDKFGKVIWKFAVGCDYDFDVKNPMKFPVKITAFKFVIGNWGNSYLYFNKLVPAGKRIEKGGRVVAHRFTSNEPLVADIEREKLFKKYGCQAQIQSGKAVLSARNKIEFPPESGIATKDAYKFVTTNQTGFVPLYNDFPK